MHTNSSNVDGVKQTEEPRWKLFEAQLKSKLQEAEGSVVKDEIYLCGEVCLCAVGGKRKAGGDGGGEEEEGSANRNMLTLSWLRLGSRAGLMIELLRSSLGWRRLMSVSLASESAVEWEPPTGIRMVKANTPFDPVGSADFSVQELKCCLKLWKVFRNILSVCQPL